MRLRLLVVLALAITSCAHEPPPPAGTPAPHCGGTAMRVHFYDVRQGLAVLVSLPDGRHVLVDAGEDAARVGCGAPCAEAAQHLQDALAADLGTAPIDMLWITHQHSDHVGGAPAVLARFRVGVYVDNGLGGSAVVERAHQAAEAASTMAVVDPEHRRVPIADSREVRLRAVVPPSWPDDCAHDANDCSIGLRVDYCSSSVLFTGDAEEQEEETLDTGPVTLLQVGHHGSDTSSSAAFLEALAPRYAVISAGHRAEGTNRTYCHPRAQTIEHLNAVLGGVTRELEAFDGEVACRNAGPEHWRTVAASARLWATERDGDVVLQTRGDGVFARR